MYNPYDPNAYAHLADDSAMIQAAVDAAAEFGEAVTIPRYNARTGGNIWHISRAILLHTGSVIYLDNCHLRQADYCVDNIFRNSNNDTPLGFTREGRQTDITIEGMGNCLLDSGEYPGVTEDNYREAGLSHNYINCMFNFVNVERVKISNIRIARHRYWSMVFHYSSHVQIRNIDFYGPWDFRNQDGIDLRSGCSHFVIENITGVTGDDVVAMTNLRNYYAPLMAGCGYDDSIHNVMIQNIRASTQHSFVRILNHGGRKIYNILIQDLMYDCESDPSDTRIRPGVNPTTFPGSYVPIHPEVYRFPQDYTVRIGTCFFHGKDPMATLGDTYNITVQNIHCRGLAGVCLSCTAKDVLIDNVHLYGQGMTGVYFAQGPIRDVHVRNISYAENAALHPEWDDRLIECELEGFEKDVAALPQRQASAVYFKNSDIEDVSFENISAGKNNTAVFSGFGKVNAVASGIIKGREDLPINGGVGLNIKVTE